MPNPPMPDALPCHVMPVPMPMQITPKEGSAVSRSPLPAPILCQGASYDRYSSDGFTITGENEESETRAKSEMQKCKRYVDPLEQKHTCTQY